MYPLPVVVAGCGDTVLPQLRRELLNNGINVEAILPSIGSTQAHRDRFRKGPHLFIVHLDKESDWEELRRLNRTFPGKPVLALMAADSDVPTILEAMYTGASHIALLPLRPPDFKTSLDCLAMQFGQMLASGQVIAVSGATGGCGATTLATNLAYDLADQHDLRVILAELSLQMGMLVTHLDIKPEYNLEDLLAYDGELDLHAVEQSLTPCGDRLSILAGPERPLPRTPEALARLTLVFDYLHFLADLSVLDLPCTFEDAYFETLLAADQVILVIEQRIPSIRNAQLVLNTLGEQRNKNPVRVVVNRYDPQQAGFTLPELRKLLPSAEVLPFRMDSVNVSHALNRGSSLRRAAPHSPLLADLDVLTQELLNLPEEPHLPQQSVPTVFGRFCHALGLA